MARSITDCGISTSLICRGCSGTVKVIAYIKDPVVIEKILTHLDKKGTPQGMDLLPEGRALPASLFE